MPKIETENHCHVLEERGWLFHSENSASTEEEYLYLLYALVYCLKPLQVLETGSYQGIGTSFMARALARNGIGHLTSLEVVPEISFFAQEQLDRDDLADWATILIDDSLKFLKRTEMKFDFAFFDSLLPLRTKELRICLERGLLKSGAFFAMHDTSRLRTLTPGNPDPETPEHWKAFESIKGIRWLEFPFSRGLTLGQVV